MAGDKRSINHRYITLYIVFTYVYYAMSNASEGKDQHPGVDGASDKPNVSKTKDEIPNLIKREEWGAMRPRLYHKIEKLIHPVPYVLISYFRPDITDDKIALQTIQYKHMEAGLPDIQSNFLIGKDGKIYEGRGWEFQPADSIELPTYNGKFLEISYVGDFNHEDLKHPIFQATWAVMDFEHK
ncbi:peptidoglycan recognition protein 1-like [Macrosteles quadrilineatus]|uniref:peptidoglycan recognition protein 1-like n=1 Tax=Macrosteles quadrilineatus TaxID=74068 RepID=UPI0023E288E4|nr:peptidoglycan recognition protein 1-like [Macrosteles quadrilineatus]